MVLLISALAKNGVTKLIFLDFGSLGGERGGGLCMRGMVCYLCIVHSLLFLYSLYTKFKLNSFFFFSMVERDHA